MKYLVLAGRFCYVLIFLETLAGHFTDASIQYAASAGVPMANIAVPFSGILAFAGGLSILLGFKAKWGAWCIILFLLPVTFIMHQYWNMTDPAQMQMQKVMFMKNLSMLGAAMMIAYMGSGPLSLDSRDRSQKTRKMDAPMPTVEVDRTATPHI